MPRKKVLVDVKSAARAHTATAINVLYGIMRSKESADMARIAAAEILLNRGWGKAVQAHSGIDGEALSGPTINTVIIQPVERGTMFTHAQVMALTPSSQPQWLELDDNSTTTIDVAPEPEPSVALS